MDYMLFASDYQKFFFLQKNFTKEKKLYSIKCLAKTKFRLKIMKFVVNFKKPLLGPAGSNPLRRIPPKTKI